MSLEELVKQVSLMNEKFDSLRQDVDSLKEEQSRARSRSPVRKSTAPVRRAVGLSSASYSEAATRRDWADRDPSETIDYNTPIQFSDEDEGDGDQLVEVSDETRKLLTDSCTRCVTNESRKKVRSHFYLPKVPAPRLDHFIKPETPQATKNLDKELAKIQTFVLDALAPLTAMVEHANSISQEDLQLASKSAIQLIGNANARISRLRREKVVSSINKSLLPMVQDDSPYANAPPELFGPDFAKKSKEFLDQVKALRAQLPAKTNQDYSSKKPLFRKGQPSGRAGAFRRGGTLNYNNHKAGIRGGRSARTDTK